MRGGTFGVISSFLVPGAFLDLNIWDTLLLYSYEKEDVMCTQILILILAVLTNDSFNFTVINVT